MYTVYIAQGAMTVPLAGIGWHRLTQRRPDHFRPDPRQQMGASGRFGALPLVAPLVVMVVAVVAQVAVAECACLVPTL